MAILQQIDHIIVVMFENRSLDNLLGDLYPAGTAPSAVLPAGGPPCFDGVLPGLNNPLSSPFGTILPQPVPATSPVSSSKVPDPDPEETWAHVNYQLFRSSVLPAPLAVPGMQGFVDDYAETETSDPRQIMQYHASTQVPVLSALARAYAVSDAWFASVPSQTWPNRAFVHAGTSNGRIDNGSPPNPLRWNVPTIFNVLTDIGVSWKIYRDTLVPSLTGLMFPKLWSADLAGNFESFGEFMNDCARGSLPKYSFIEPRFVSDVLHEPNDFHPPHDINEGEAFLFQIWQAVSTSKNWEKTLLVITFDEHGGCYDHVPPPWGATPPDAASSPGDSDFGFDRFGVRVPTVLVSPYIAAGTVFRSPTQTPYDHTSILSTLRDWIGIPANKMLGSARVLNAPTLGQVLTLAAPRTALPSVQLSTSVPVAPDLHTKPNDLQMSMVAAAAARGGEDVGSAMASTYTRQHVVDFFKQRLGTLGP